MPKFIELSDEHWAIFQRIFPKNKKKRGRGMPRADLRKTLNSVLYILINGCRWADLPRNTDIYTSKSSAHRALQRWKEDGTLEIMKRHILVLSDYKRKINWGHASIDGSFSPWERRRTGR
jgi:transposase